MLESKITKIQNFKDNPERKFPYQMAKSNTSNEWNTTGIFLTWYIISICRPWWVQPGL